MNILLSIKPFQLPFSTNFHLFWSCNFPNWFFQKAIVRHFGVQKRCHLRLGRNSCWQVSQPIFSCFKIPLFVNCNEFSFCPSDVFNALINTFKQPIFFNSITTLTSTKQILPVVHSTPLSWHKMINSQILIAPAINATLAAKLKHDLAQP